MAGDKLTLVFFVDALGWEIARNLGCFRDVAPYSYRQRTVLGYSCAAQPTRLIVPSYMGGRAPRGMHGFSPEHRDSYAMLASSFEVDPEPTHIRDSFRVMMQAAGLQPGPETVDGHGDSAGLSGTASGNNQEVTA